MTKSNFKVYILMATYAILFYFFCNNLLGEFWNFVCKVMFLLTPFVYGFSIAYLLNWPYEFFMKKLFHRTPEKLRKCFALILTYMVFLGIISTLIAIITPQLTGSISKLVDNIYALISDDQNHIYASLNSLGLERSFAEKAYEILNNLLGNLQTVLSNLLRSIYDITTKVLIEIYNFLIGLVISVYFLFGKEKLLTQLKKLKNILVPKRMQGTLTEILTLSHKKVGGFMIAKVIESLIVGAVCYIGTLCLGTQYALLISVVIGLTNIVPLLGPFLGGVPCAFIILTEDPIKALWFAVFILILHQIDANIIGPRILGSAIGLSGLWIMLGVILGGGLFGIVGMVLGVPICSVIYTLTSRSVNKKLKKIQQNTNQEKI